VSLLVHVYRRTDGAASIEFIDDVQRSELAGPEQWRKTVYGSPIVVALRATVVPRWRPRTSIWSRRRTWLPPHSTAGSSRCTWTRSRPPPRASRDDIADRVRNVEEALDIAREIGAFVVVW